MADMIFTVEEMYSMVMMKLQDPILLWHYCREFRCSGMWVVPNISKVHSAFIFIAWAVQEYLLDCLSPEGEVAAFLWHVKKHFIKWHPKRSEPSRIKLHLCLSTIPQSYTTDMDMQHQEFYILVLDGGDWSAWYFVFVPLWKRVLGGCSGKDRNHALAGTQKSLVDSIISHFPVSSQLTQYFPLVNVWCSLLYPINILSLFIYSIIFYFTLI